MILRFLTGLFLAGVYPVGMKIAIGWGTRDRGWLVGLVVGGLTLGSAAPHLLAYLGGANWQLTTVLASGIALLAAIMIMLTGLGPHHGDRATLRPGDDLTGMGPIGVSDVPTRVTSVTCGNSMRCGRGSGLQ